MKFIDGGVCAAQGFQASGLHVGVKTHATWKKDVALIVSDVDCAAAAVFTKNVVKAAPIHVDKAHLANGKARAIIANSGNANACAPMGDARYNMGNSLMVGCAKMGMHFVACAPKSYFPDRELIEKCQAIAAETGATLEFIEDPMTSWMPPWRKRHFPIATSCASPAAR